MAKVYAVTSGKGGVGKTTIVATLGIMIASMGFRVLVIDMDLGLNNLDLALGLEDEVLFDISDIVSNKCRIKQAIVTHGEYDNLHFLASKNVIDICVNAHHIEYIIDSVRSEYDYIFIDSPAGIGVGFKRVLSSVDNIIVVVTPHLSSIRDAKKVSSIIDKYNLNGKYMVINKMRGDLVLDGEMIDVSHIQKYVDLELLGVIPEDDYINRVLVSFECGVGKVSQKAISLIANTITTGEYKIYDCEKRYRGVMGYIRRALKRIV